MLLIDCTHVNLVDSLIVGSSQSESTMWLLRVPIWKVSIEEQQQKPHSEDLDTVTIWPLGSRLCSISSTNQLHFCGWSQQHSHPRQKRVVVICDGESRQIDTSCPASQWHLSQYPQYSFVLLYSSGLWVALIRRNRPRTAVPSLTQTPFAIQADYALMGNSPSRLGGREVRSTSEITHLLGTQPRHHPALSYVVCHS